MKKMLLLLLLPVSVTVYADGIFHKKDAAVMKQIQYRRVMAIEQIKILEKYVQCLNNADDLKKMNICTEINEKAADRLLKESQEIKKEVGQKTKS